MYLQVIITILTTTCVHPVPDIHVYRHCIITWSHDANASVRASVVRSRPFDLSASSSTKDLTLRATTLQLYYLAPPADGARRSTKHRGTKPTTMNEMTASECGSVDLQTVIANLQTRLSDNEHERSELQNSLHAHPLVQPRTTITTPNPTAN